MVIPVVSVCLMINISGDITVHVEDTVLDLVLDLVVEPSDDSLLEKEERYKRVFASEAMAVGAGYLQVSMRNMNFNLKRYERVVSVQTTGNKGVAVSDPNCMVLVTIWVKQGHIRDEDVSGKGSVDGAVMAENFLASTPIVVSTTV